MKQFTLFFVLLLALMFAVGEEAQAQLGTRATVLGNRIVANDSLRSQGPATFNSTTSHVGISTFSGQITLSGITVGTVDSFSTTSATKAVALTGATLGDLFIVTPLTTTYSTVVDTNAAFYYTRYDSSGYVTVGRAALLGQALKSGAHFQLLKLNK